MSRYHLTIFATGGITLALELLASRILSPYFGVSLFIWTGILSITLIALAVGYWWGGRLAARCNGNESQLTFLFALMPSVSCLSMLVAALIYPKLFVPLANFHLIMGSFLACCLLLLVPLVTVSAMNPLLVALSASQLKSNKNVGDAGAGWVFFVSTTGSVLGVLVTAFVLIPNITNFRSLLILAIALAALAIGLAIGEKQLDAVQRRRLLRLAIFGGIATALLLAFATQYLQKDKLLTHANGEFRIIHERPTFFGNIKVVDSTSPSPGGKLNRRAYLMDGLAQCVLLDDRRSGSSYTYSMEALGRGMVSDAKRILVLGLGGGILPMRYADDGTEIDVVEINPQSIPLAVEYFKYDDKVANHHVMDARVFVRETQNKYDIIYADLFHGDATPEYLLSAEFMSDLAGCLTPRGGVVFNMVGHSDPRFEPALYSYVKTAKAVWPNVLFFHPGNPGLRNLMLIASADSLDSFRPANIDIPRSVRGEVMQLLAIARPLDEEKLRLAPVLTDDRNVSSNQHAWFYLQTRIPVLNATPSQLLVN